jgi:putative ABC transport system permease protein
MKAALRRFFRRLVNGLRPGRGEIDLARELASHLTLLEDECRRRGMSVEEARRTARLALGGVDQAKELHRDARGFVWIDDAGRDIRYVVRTLRNNVGFTMAVVVTIAVAISGIGAVFSLVNTVLFRPLPYRDAARLVMIWEDDTRDGFPRNDVAPVNYAWLASHHEAFASLAAVDGYSVTLNGSGAPEKIEGRRVTHSFFEVLASAPALGRVFRPDEDRPGAPHVTILSHRLWQGRFGGDPNIVGRGILLGDERFEVVGVMPAGFQFLESYVGLWVPAAFSPEELRSSANYLTVVARLNPDVSLSLARANLETLSARMVRDLPAAAQGSRMKVVSLEEQLAGDARRPLLVLLAAVGVVMLIACANVASLLLARAAARRHEIALRSSLGASRGRIVRQLLTESLVLCGLGCLVGVMLANWVLVFLEQLVPPSMTFFAQPTLDARTLGFTVLVSLIAGVLCGLAPALHVTKSDLGPAVKTTGRGVSGSESRRSGLVIAEVAMTLVLLVVAGLLMQTLYRLRYADIGFSPDHVLTLRTSLPPEKYATHARRTAFYDGVLERVTHLPGVAAAGYTTSVPLEWKGGTTSVVIEGRAPDPSVTYDVNHRQVSADYLAALGIPLVQGRYFTASDREGGQPVVILNKTMARQYWPGGNVIGKRIKPDDRAAPAWLTIVGVVGDVRQMGLDAPVKAEMYVPYRQFDAQPWFAPRDLVVRTVGDPIRLAGSIAHEIHSVDPAQPVSNIRPANEILDEDVAARRVGTIVLLAFAAFSVLLAVVGIYGVIAFFVVQHIPEIGVRIALGAETRDILALVAGKGVTLTLIGVGIGCLAAVAATRLVSSLLYGFSGFDPTVIVCASVLLVLLAMVASYVPARRATRLDPVVALRYR